MAPDEVEHTGPAVVKAYASEVPGALLCGLHVSAQDNERLWVLDYLDLWQSECHVI